MKNKIIFASAFLSLALVVGSIGSVFANEVAPADNQPATANEAEQPAGNVEQPADSDAGDAKEEDEASAKEYVLIFVLADFSREIATHDRVKVKPDSPREFEGYRFAKETVFERDDAIVIQYLYEIIEDEENITFDKDGKIVEDASSVDNSKTDTATATAKKSKSPNTSDPASVGLGVMAMVSALGGFATLRKKK